MTYVFFLLALLLVFFHARFDHRSIQRGYEINHVAEGFIVGAITFGIGWILLAFSGKDYDVIKWLAFCAVVTLLTRIAWYDFTLNYLRKRPLWYTSETTTSTVDQFERKLGINENVIRLLGVIAWIAVLVLHRHLNLE